MKQRTVTILLIVLAAHPVLAGQKESPSQTAVSFYRALKEKRFVDGFKQSVYRAAIEGLTAAELKDLEPEFIRTFSGIPDKIEPRQEEIKGDAATVYLKFEGIEKLQGVQMIRVGGEWLVGDQESLEMVREQGRKFFFNTRITVSENETAEVLARLIDAETLYAQKREGHCASIQELIKLNALPKDLESGETGGYRFVFTLGQDGMSYSSTATPVEYGKTGRLSFYADAKGLRAEDLKGQRASASSPMYSPR
jgi:hypothetical protein